MTLTTSSTIFRFVAVYRPLLMNSQNMPPSPYVNQLANSELMTPSRSYPDRSADFSHDGATTGPLLH